MYDNSIIGLRMNLESLSRAAERVARPDLADLPEETVNMMVAERGFEANLVALRTSMEMSRRVLDLFA